VTWKAYRVVFKLKSPMHIGCGKVGNVQRTRPYVTGRVFWGALTMRLTRDKCAKEHKPATQSEDYQSIGDKVNQLLGFSYFYPAISQIDQISYHWDKENQFRHRFLSSYTSTALVYSQQAADEGLLHEVEFLSPRTLDEGKQVYLIGYVFEKDNSTLKWRDACTRLQMGGERGYGWGMVELIDDPVETQALFGGQVTFNGDGDQPIIQSETLLAHTLSTGLSATGEIEPMVGREWRSNNSINRYAGQHVEKFCTDLCWIPGSTVEQSQNFVIRDFGIWTPLS
jgi:hypothetical protein